MEALFLPRATKKSILLNIILSRVPPPPPRFSLSSLSSVRWSSRWRRQMPSDGRSWRARDRSPTSNTSIPVSLQLLHLHSFHPAVLLSLPSSVHLSLSPLPSSYSSISLSRPFHSPPSLSLSFSLCLPLALSLSLSLSLSLQRSI